jgi:hypothetical protein
MSDQQLIPVFIPALVTLLAHSEQLKGSPFTEQEVLEVRDKGACIMMRVDNALALDEKRGYGDIDPEQAWEQWQRAPLEIMPGEGEKPARDIP